MKGKFKNFTLGPQRSIFCQKIEAYILYAILRSAAPRMCDASNLNHFSQGEGCFSTTLAEMLEVFRIC